MYYSNGKSKEAELYPNIMKKEDTKELSSIINLLNSTSSPNEKIGLNLQYRQVKLPQKIINDLKERKTRAQKYLENEKKDENNINIIALYEENKSKEEQYKRDKLIENNNLEKNIKKLNSEENNLMQEIENIQNNLKNLSQKINIIKSEKERIQNSIRKFKLDEIKISENFAETKEKNNKKLKELEKLKNVENIMKEKKNIKEEELIIKKFLCYKCKVQPRIFYYSSCEHLALCKNCYVHTEHPKCPICLRENNQFIIKVILEKTNNDYI